MALFIALLFSGCENGVPTLEYEVVRRLPHDPQAYTQGLLFHDGILFESTGRRGSSSVRKVDPESGAILAIRHLPEAYFGEGLALVGDELVQLTWQSGVAFVYDAETLEEVKSYEYDGEGWGVCFDGESLFVSDGSDKLLRRNPSTFAVEGEIQVTRGGLSVWRLNELECVGDDIYANVYQTNDIVRIDKRSGHVTGQIDAYNLSVATRRTTDPEAVLNGIAYDPSTGLFYITGKLWPILFEVEIPDR
jgi:glutamine cyclotransferase